MEGTFFYTIGIVLTVLAVGISFLGLANDRFPTSKRLIVGVVGVFALLVVLTTTSAIMTAREEQRERNEELAAHQQEEVAEEEAAEEPEAEAPPGDAEEIDVDLGAQVFADEGCGTCHTFAAAGTEAAVGPDLDETLEGRDSDYIEQGIVDPQATTVEGFQDGVMPEDYGDRLTEFEIASLVLFLEQGGQ